MCISAYNVLEVKKKEENMAKRIPLSFKENDRDMRLYMEVLLHGDKSNFIKDCIEYWVKNTQKCGKEQKIKV